MHHSFKDYSPDTIVLEQALMLTIAGVLSTVMTALGDKLHYMNRDINTWTYGCESFVLALVGLSSIFSLLR